MSIALANQVQRAHERLDRLEETLTLDELGKKTLEEALSKIEHLEGEIKAMKARMGKKEYA